MQEGGRAKGRAWIAVGGTALIGLLSASIVATQEPGVREIRAVIRLTAAFSLVTFLAAFTASALHRLVRSPVTRWIVANRRYIGLTFAGSQMIHQLAILALARVDAVFAANISTTTLVVGGGAYVFIVSMALTSNDRAVRALGPRAWKALHTTGMGWIWFVFVATYSGHALISPFHALMTAALIGALALRIVARRARRRVEAPVRDVA